MRTHAAASSGLVVLAASVGCSLLTSTDDLTGAVDAGVDHAVTDAASVDAPADAPADVAADTPADRSGDAPADAPAAPFCSSLMPAPSLCEDFDGNNGFAAQFTQTNEPSPNHLGSDGAFFKSSPRSFFSKIDMGAANTDRYAYMYKDFALAATHVSYGFDVLMQDVVSGKTAEIGAIVIDLGGASQHRIAFIASGVDAAIEESFAGDAGTVYLDKTLSVFPAVNRWARVQIDLALTPSPAKLTVTVDGATALGGATLDPSWPTSGSVHVDVGISYVDGTAGPWTVRFDNVTIDKR